MIVAERKPMDEICQLVGDAKTVLILGCGECVTVCLAGGEKEVDLLSAALRLKWQTEGRELSIKTATPVRQCEPEYLADLDRLVEDVDLIISMACGVGVQFVAERYGDKWVVPALNTRFAGGTVQAGMWEERCGMCGECVLHLTGGICPVARCSKSLLNGPCGGSHDGKCEIEGDVACGWQLIHDRLAALGRLDLITSIMPAKDWSRARDGGPRKVTREDALI